MRLYGTTPKIPESHIPVGRYSGNLRGCPLYIKREVAERCPFIRSFIRWATARVTPTIVVFVPVAMGQATLLVSPLLNIFTTNNGACSIAPQMRGLPMH
jgi:hypothetical protein